MEFCGKKHRTRERKKNKKYDCVRGSCDDRMGYEFNVSTRSGVKVLEPLLSALEEVKIQRKLVAASSVGITLNGCHNRLEIGVGGTLEPHSTISIIDRGLEKQEILFRFQCGTGTTERSYCYYIQQRQAKVVFQTLEEATMERYNIQSLKTLRYFNTPPPLRTCMDTIAYDEELEVFLKPASKGFMDKIDFNTYTARKNFRRYGGSYQYCFDRRGDTSLANGILHKRINDVWWETYKDPQPRTSHIILGQMQPEDPLE